MANIVGVDLNVDQDYLEQAVRDTVIMGISEALNGKNEIVSQLVHEVLSIKVNGDGKVSGWSSDNKYSLLEYYVRRLITDEVKAQIKAICEERREEIGRIIHKELSEQLTADVFTTAFINAAADSLNYSWKTNIDISFEKRDEEY